MSSTQDKYAFRAKFARTESEPRAESEPRPLGSGFPLSRGRASGAPELPCSRRSIRKEIRNFAEFFGKQHRTSFFGLLGCVIAALCALSVVAFSQEPNKEVPNFDRTINIVAERFTFVPSVVKLKHGETVELRLRSLDTNHGFAIAEAGVNVIVPKRGGGEARILFRAKERGEFPFFCSKACGAGHTIMRGRIVVE